VVDPYVTDRVLEMDMVICLCGSTIKQSSLTGHLLTKKHAKYLQDIKTLPPPPPLPPNPNAGPGMLYDVDVNMLNSIVLTLPRRAIQNLYQTSVHCTNVVGDYTGLIDHTQLYELDLDPKCLHCGVMRYIACICVYAIAVGANKFTAQEYMENVKWYVAKSQPVPRGGRYDAYSTVGDDGMDYFFPRSDDGSGIGCLPLWTFKNIHDVYRFMANNGFAISPSQAVSDTLSDILGIHMVDVLSIPFGDYLQYTHG
jgi:hypothetical protein